MGRTGEASEQKMEHKKKIIIKKEIFFAPSGQRMTKLKEQVQKGLEYHNMSMWPLVILTIILQRGEKNKKIK